MLAFVIPEANLGKARPRFRIAGKGAKRFVHVYTPQETQDAEARVREQWRAAGALHLGEGPLEVDLEFVFERPASHFRKGGELSAEGLRHPVPLGSNRRPDLDNAMKLVTDALNRHAYRDDGQLVRASQARRWARPGEAAHTAVRIAPLSATPDHEGRGSE